MMSACGTQPANPAGVAKGNQVVWSNVLNANASTSS